MKKIILLSLAISVLVPTAYAGVIYTSCPSTQEIYDAIKNNAIKNSYKNEGSFLWTTDKRIPYKITYYPSVQPYDVKLEALLNSTGVSFKNASIDRTPAQAGYWDGSGVICSYELGNVEILARISIDFDVRSRNTWVFGGNWADCGGPTARCCGRGYTSAKVPEDCAFTIKTVKVPVKSDGGI